MFQKFSNETGVLFSGVRTPASDMNLTEAEHSFGRARRRATARSSRATANTGMFCRGNRAYRHG